MNAITSERTDAAFREREAALDRLFGELYQAAVHATSFIELQELACRRLAAALNLPLVMFARKQDTGTVAVTATSRENALWIELQHLPERWDSTIVGNGPAGVASHTGVPAHMRVSNEGFMPWRLAAEREHIRAAAAWPFTLPDGTGALQLFSAAEDTFDSPASKDSVRDLVRRLEAFFKDWAVLAKQRLLAQALECAGNAAFITDVHGTIVWANRSFSNLSGYASAEVVGKNPSFLQSGKQGIRYYRDLWNTIRAGRVWSGETVDRDKSGTAYTIRQTVSPVALEDRVTHYVSIHEDITRQKEEQARHELLQGVDSVTGLLTRAAFEKAFREALTTPGIHLSLMLISMPEFQRVVTELDTEMEELVTATVGERIDQAVKDPHTAGVLAPGEYAVLLRDSADGIEAARKLEEKLRKTMPEPIPLLGQSVPLTFRVVVARYPEDGATINELMRAADRKLADQPLARARRKLAAG